MCSTWRPSQCLFGGSPCTLAACLPVGKDEQKGRERKRMMRRWREGQIQISLASVWQRMWEMNCLIGTFVSIRRRSSVSAMTEGAPRRSSASGLPSFWFHYLDWPLKVTSCSSARQLHIHWHTLRWHLMKMRQLFQDRAAHGGDFLDQQHGWPRRPAVFMLIVTYSDHQIWFRNKKSTEPMNDCFHP